MYVVYTHTPISIHTKLYIYICSIYIYVHICLYTHKHTYTDMFVDCALIPISIQTKLYIHIYTYLHTYIHIYTYTFIYRYVYIEKKSGYSTCTYIHIHVFLYFHTFVFMYIYTFPYRVGTPTKMPDRVSRILYIPICIHTYLRATTHIYIYIQIEYANEKSAASRLQYSVTSTLDEAVAENVSSINI